MKTILKSSSIICIVIFLIFNYFIGKDKSQAEIPINIPINPEVNNAQKYSASNHKYIFNTFLQNLPILAIQKDEFETTEEYNKRLLQAHNNFNNHLIKKGVNINNYYNIKLNKKNKPESTDGSYVAVYDADKELVMVGIDVQTYSKRNEYQGYATINIDSINSSKNIKSRGGMIIHTSSQEYKLIIRNLQNNYKKILIFDLDRNKARELLSENNLGVIIICKFALPYIHIDKNSGSLFDRSNFVSEYIYNVFQGSNVKDMTFETEKKYLIVEAERIIVYNIKNGQKYSEYNINENTQKSNKNLPNLTNFYHNPYTALAGDRLTYHFF